MITEYMESQNVSRGALAAQIGISPSLVDQMEEGYLPQRKRDLIISRLAAVMGVSVAALFLPSEAKTA